MKKLSKKETSDFSKQFVKDLNDLLDECPSCHSKKFKKNDLCLYCQRVRDISIIEGKRRLI